jgi:hypothetical protein
MQPRRMADLLVRRGPQRVRARCRLPVGRALGRLTFEHFVHAWPSITEVESLAKRNNTTPKFVSSRTLTESLGWNATLIHGEALEEVYRLKQDPQK